MSGQYFISALKDDSSFLGIPLSGKYEGIQMKADMKCLVDGLTTKLEERFGENGRDGITHAMHYLSLSSWPRRIKDAGIKITVF